ncbi:MAG TPA: ferrochelatase [Candidatus Limnocylindrales bacterium]|nr:ferrochelatase [Candidatus Limnocylindrales bacterium]
MPSPDRPTGVLLMTYGSPSSLEDVERYMTAVRGGRAPEPDLLTEFRRRYDVIGGSPLVEITRRQAAAVEGALGDGWRVRAAMRFSAPTIADALRELAAAGVREAVGIVMSPQYSPLLMGGYGRAVEAARADVGEDAPNVTIAGDWYREPWFVDAVGSRVREAIERLPADERSSVPVLLTAHSLPRRVAEQEPGYLRQLEETAELVAAASGIGPDRWRFCWQSAGHEPGEWMKPDFADLMPELAVDGHRSVVVAPVQFLADHLEILYDVDVGAREQAESAGLRFERIRSLNDDPTFVAALASVARETFSTPAGR